MWLIGLMMAPLWAPPARFPLEVKTVQGVRVEVVTIRLDDPKLRVRLMVPPDGAGGKQPFAQYVKGIAKVGVAVPGAFFSKQNWRPVGNLIDQYRMINQAPANQAGTTVIFDHQNRAQIRRGLSYSLHYRIGEGQEYWQGEDHNLLHGLNTPLPSVSSLKLFNFYFPAPNLDLGANGMAAVLEGGVVKEILTGGQVHIPPQGHVIAAVDSASEKIRRLQAGDKVRLVYRPNQKGVSTAKVAVGAGPAVLLGGVVDVQPEQEGFRDPHVTMAMNRVLFGLSGNVGKVVIVRAGVSLQKAGQIMKALGCTDALNLDGGASAALYHNGVIRQAPGRPLTNLLVFE